MLIQIKDYEYLRDRMLEGPTINSEMLEMAGMRLYIEDDEYSESNTYHIQNPATGSTWEWLGSWFNPVDESIETDPNTITYDLKDTNLTVEAFEKMSMPPNLQYITLQSKSVVDNVEYRINNAYQLKIQKHPEENIRVKFTDSSEYNLVEYFRGSAQNLIDETPVQFLRNVRNQESAVHFIVKQILARYVGQEFVKQPYFAKLRNGWVFKPRYNAHIYYNGEFDTSRYRMLIDSATYNTGGSLQYIGLATVVCYFAAHTQAKFIQLEETDYQKVVHDYMSIEKLKTKVDKSKFYIFDGNSPAYGFDKIKFKDILVDNNKTFVCPHTGIENFSTHKDSKITPFVYHSLHFIRDSYGVSVRPLSRKNISEEEFKDFYNDVVDYLPEKYQYAKLFKKLGERFVSPSEYERITARNKAYKKYNLEFLGGNRMIYDGREEYIDEEEVIKEYDYAPSIELFGDSDDLHLGVELEVDKGGEDHYNAAIANIILGWQHAYCMHDGSINDGFEIATMPMTLDYHMSMAQRYRDAFGILTAQGYKSHNTTTCGMHIHFDRDFLGSDSRTRTIKASYLAIIMERNWEKFVQFSRRNYDRVDQWSKKLDLVKDIYADDTDYDATQKFADKYGNGDKYVALNTAHRYSYELRIFRGTLKPETFLATIQFVDNLVRVAKECPSLAKAQQITFANIIDYKHHKELIEYVNTRGILTREYKEYEGE